MQRYRSLESKEAVQYLGEPIPDVTCEGTGDQKMVNGCDPSRAHLPHVHTAATGGLTCLKPGDWIMPIVGGPFVAVSDGLFRSYFEVPPPSPGLFLVPAPEPEPIAKKQAAPLPLAPEHPES